MLELFRPLSTTEPETIMKLYGLLAEAHGAEQPQTVPHRQALRQLVVNGEEAQYFIGHTPETQLAVMALYFRYDKTSNVEALAVDHRLRGRQIGSRALSELIDLSYSDGSEHIKLVSLSASVGFYERAGFEVTETDGKHFDMVKHLKR